MSRRLEEIDFGRAHNTIDGIDVRDCRKKDSGKENRKSRENSGQPARVVQESRDEFLYSSYYVEKMRVGKSD